METIEIKSMTSIEEAIHVVLRTAKQKGTRVVADFNDFILDSKNSYDKNLDLYWSYMGRADKNTDWEQRRYEIAKEMLHDCVEYFDDISSLIDVDKRVESSTKLAIKFADALISKLKKETRQ